ncbi:Hypothetical protein Tpal_2681 [Trichococcus palustris]|uniref:Uncharacterized protein n=1 Tax=Trichococcus palustris TaxID=140314 RepID=A0A143YYL0_9LACT|nr:Hypothetical protein Tpal_2681 [Trichococcus palustris]SFL17847.1 hypothetical protein SAMN04488076_13015 [Trichococcus palustris]
MAFLYCLKKIESDKNPITEMKTVPVAVRNPLNDLLFENNLHFDKENRVKMGMDFHFNAVFSFVLTLCIMDTTLSVASITSDRLFTILCLLYNK